MIQNRLDSSPSHTVKKQSSFFGVLIFVAAGSRRSALLTADRPSRTFAMDRESLERNVNAHIERVVTRAFDLAPARAALGTAAVSYTHLTLPTIRMV